MPYDVIFTHNPQSFFEGAEPEDLALCYTVGDHLSELKEYQPLVDGGYKMIVIKQDSQNT